MIIDILKHTIMITAFVLVMMLIIEYINVQTRGSWVKPLQNKGWLQIVIAAVLGAIPGCLGTYTAVSLYSHKIFSFAALVTVMIATSGDEAFLMLSIIPEKAILLFVIIFFIAIITGLIIYFFFGNKTMMKLPENHMQVHEGYADCICFELKGILGQLKRISFQRTILIVGIILFLFGLISGEFGHNHDFITGGDHSHETEMVAGHEEDHLIIDEAELQHAHESESQWNWISITFLIVSLIALFIITTVNDHFLEEHLWAHIIKKHFLKIFLWTFGALLLIHFLNDYIDIEHWIKSNMFSILIIAVLIGIIPQSGPHYIFILLFVQGVIPFSILMANSIVQDGHGAIPLLAESKKSFIVVKLVNLAIGFIIGAIGIYAGF